MTDPAPRYVDTETRYEGVFARHRLKCRLAVGGERCNCEPSYYGTVWDKDIDRNRRTKRYRLIGEARNARTDLQREVKEGVVVTKKAPRRTFEQTRKAFIEACREGTALNNKRKPYKSNAITNLESSLKRFSPALRREDVGALRQADFQNEVDGFIREGLSSSRISSIINAARSMYRWAEERGRVDQSAPAGVRVPLVESEERERIATPGEFALLLNQLEPHDALPWALAGYGTARSQEIRTLEWPEVDLEHDVVLFADDDDARKSEAARRIVPLVKPLRRRLRAEWVRQGRPSTGRVCPPRARSTSGLISLNQLQKRRREIWIRLNLKPIGLQDSRHTAATWLDHAGVSPKVASVFMGHKAPRRQAGAAPITLRRYTHVLPGELERARDQLDLFLAEREAEERDHL